MSVVESLHCTFTRVDKEWAHEATILRRRQHKYQSRARFVYLEYTSVAEEVLSQVGTLRLIAAEPCTRNVHKLGSASNGHIQQLADGKSTAWGHPGIHHEGVEHLSVGTPWILSQTPF